MKTSLILVYAFALMLIGCNTTQTKEAEAEESTSLNEYSLSKVGLPLVLLLPEKIDSVQSSWNASFGKAEVDGGEHFNLTVQEIDATIQQKKEDLELGIFQIEYLEQDSNHIIYQTALPDGSQNYYHFYAVKNISGNTYTFENNQLMVFSLPDIKKMAQTAILSRPIAK